MQAKCLVRVERRAGRLGILRDQLQIAERGDRRDDGAARKAPRGAPDLTGNLAGRGIHTGAGDVADDEQQDRRGPITRFSSVCVVPLGCSVTAAWLSRAS